MFYRGWISIPILDGKGVYSQKYITAEITDSKNQIHYVPIKHEIGDYFIAKIDEQLYAFSLKNARILTWKKTLAKSFQVIQYDTCHFSSLKPEIKELELMIEKNSLPKVDSMMQNVLRILARREKTPFKPHDLEDLVAVFAEQAGQFPEEVRNIKAYLDELDVNHIVTPTRRVTDFIQNDLIATVPSFLGEAVPRLMRMDNEHKKMTNTPTKNSSGLMKMILIILVVVVGVIGIAFAYSEGAFDGITGFVDNLGTIGDGFSGIPAPGQFQTGTSGGVDYSDAAIQARYTPEGLKSAIASGEVDYDKLSGSMKTMVDSVEIPTVEAVP